MKPPPPGWPRISTALYYDDANRAIDWLCRVFGFELQLKVAGDDGTVHHSELVFGGGLVMVSESSRNERFPYRRSPTQIEGLNTQNMMVYVDDVEAHCRHARESGAQIVSELETHDYGEDYWTDRAYQCKDLGGHHWWFCERLRSPKTKSAS
jgi:uncharacterized glyoxalase superfamily protein PhnB